MIPSATLPLVLPEVEAKIRDSIEMLKRFSDYNRVPRAMVSARQVYEIACYIEAALTPKEAE